MTPQLWIGFGFAVVLVGFLIVSFFVRPELTRSQHATIRFLSSLCAGFAAGFLTGGALFEYAKSFPDGGKIAFTGVAGFGLFGLIWVTYPGHQPELPKPSLTVAVEAGWTFSQAAHVIAQKDQCVVEFKGFTDAEKNSLLRHGRLSSETAEGVLRQLRGLSTAEIREYSVNRSNGIFLLNI